MPNFINVGGTWKNISKIYQNVGASWKNVTKGYVNVAGAWKVFFSSQYTFSFGDHLYVGSNGYIGLDAGGTTADTMGAGRNISIYNIDLQQWYLAEYSDTSTYSLYFRSYLYNTIGSPSSLNALDYQIKFYNDVTKPYCDVYIVRKGSNVGFAVKTPGYYTNGNSGGTGIQGPYVLGTGSTMRIYFNGTVATTSGISWSAIDVNYWDLIRDDRPTGLDDSFTDVTTATNQSAPIPANTVAPTLTTSDSNNFSAGSTITINAGTWTNAGSYDYELHVSTSTPISLTSTSTKTLVSTNQYVITNSDAAASSYYFRGKVTAYVNADKTGNSTVAWTTTSARSYINPTTTISVATATKTGFTISGTAGPIGRVSISAIYIYNSSQVLSTTIDTGLPTVDATTGAWSYVWTGGAGTTTYYAKAQALSTDSAGTTFTTAFSDSITTLAAKPPNTPTSPGTSGVSSTNITFSWTASTSDATHLGPTSYDIYTSTSSTDPTAETTPTDTTLVSVVTKSFTYTASASPSTRYFWVRAQGLDGASAWTAAVSATPTAVKPPNDPTGVSATKNATTPTTKIDVSWTAPLSDSTHDLATGYDIYYTSGATQPTAPTSGTSATTTSTAVSKEIASLSSGTKYWFWVRATNTDGKSGWAGPASATTDAAATAPAAPTGVTIGTLVYDHPILDLANTLTRITNTSKRQDWTYSATVNYPISWTKSTGATTYEIYASGSATAPTSGTSGNVSTDTGDVSSYSSYKPTQSQRGTLTRYIWVRASNTTGNSAWAAASTNAGGGKTSVATVVSGLVLRIWRGNGTASSTPSPTPPANTAITYLWSVTSRGDPNNATTPGEGHYCTIDQYFTIAGVDDYATASDTV
jgi:hypothetical protein